MAEIGVINEIGDMGLGFDLLNEKDQKAYNESANKEKDNESNSKENWFPCPESFIYLSGRYYWWYMINNIFDSTRYYSFIKTIKNLRAPSSKSVFYINRRYGHISITEKAYYNKIKLDNFICCCYSISDLPHNKDDIHPMYACKNIKIDKNNMI